MEEDDEYYGIEDDEYYETDDDDDDDDENFFTRLGDAIANMSAADHMVAMFGIFILIAAVATGVIFFSARTVSEQVEAFAEIGSEIENIRMIGESGLTAVAEAEASRALQGGESEAEDTEEAQEEENTQAQTIEVGINLASIQSDLKIKFVNKETNKLIGGVPFEVQITGNTTLSLRDEDEDGIIYQTGIGAGTYTVQVMPLEGEEFDKYRFPAQGETVKVTDTINYKKVEVADEIKTEAEVNVAAEDTAQQNTVESALTDTVEWVESTKTEKNADGNYEEIKRADIPDPMTLAMADGFMKLVNDRALQPAAVPASMDMATGSAVRTVTDETIGSDTTTSDGTTGSDTTTSSGTTGSDTTTSSGTTGSDTTTSTGSTGTGTPGTGTTSSSTTTNTPPPAAMTDADKLNALAPQLNTKTLSLTKGESATLSVQVKGNEAYIVEWSSNSSAVSVTNGTVKGLAAGTAAVTATVRVGTASVPLNCTVTVKEAAVKYTEVKIEGDSKIRAGGTGSVKGKTTPEGGVITWSSDNTNVLTIDKDGKITGVMEGTATVTGVCGDAKGTWKVTVTKNYAGDTTTKLKDKNGNQIYRKNGDGQYVEAVYADYYNDHRLYLRKVNADCFYTGWQTIDGYTYFFDKNGNYVTGEQIIQGARYSFDSQGRISSGSGSLGIDVSKWNGSIDWNAVKNSGVSYVIIRCGYRGSSTGALIEDPKFTANIKGAKAAGLKVGVYFFSQAVNEVEAVEEASMALNLVSGYGLEYPIFLDVEASGGRGDAIDAATRTAVCRAFCATIQNSGYKAGIYANKTWLSSKINTGSLTDFKIWLAQYASAPSYTSTRYDMWQYTSKGSVKGISGSVDMNISYLNY